MKMDMAEQQTQLMPQFHGTYSHRPGQVEPRSSVAVGKPCKERYVALGQAGAGLCRVALVAEGHGDR